MSNQIIKLADIFKYHIILTETEYINHLFKYVNKFNHLNIENNKRLYSVYVNIMKLIISENIKSGRNLIKLTTLTKLGIYSITNFNKQYWLDRGYSEKEATDIISKNSSTNTIEAIKKKCNCTLKEAEEILHNRAAKGQQTLNSRTVQEISEINYKKGKSTRKTDLLKTINPHTKSLYTEEEIHILWKTRYGWSKNKKLTKEQRSNNNCTLEFYLKRGFSLHEAKIELNNRQTTFSLDVCIEKYGEIDGLKRWQKRQDKWMSTMDAKSPEEKLEILIKKIKRPNFWSKESILFFDELINEINILIPNNNFTYYYKNNEYYINSKGKFYLYDFTIKELDIIIEYNGSHVHPNTNMSKIEWDKWYNPFTKETANESHSKDMIKNQAALDRGYDLIVIWDKEVKIKTKNKTISNILDIIKNKYNTIWKK